MNDNDVITSHGLLIEIINIDGIHMMRAEIDYPVKSISKATTYAIIAEGGEVLFAPIDLIMSLGFAKSSAYKRVEDSRTNKNDIVTYPYGKHQDTGRPDARTRRCYMEWQCIKTVLKDTVKKDLEEAAYSELTQFIDKFKAAMDKLDGGWLGYPVGALRTSHKYLVGPRKPRACKSVPEVVKETAKAAKEVAEAVEPITGPVHEEPVEVKEEEEAAAPVISQETADKMAEALLAAEKMLRLYGVLGKLAAAASAFAEAARKEGL